MPRQCQMRSPVYILQNVLTMRGDIFEMEDQRNWSDASFKTYCTPLALPFPVEIDAGTAVTQEVCISLLGMPGDWAAPLSGNQDIVVAIESSC